MALPDFEYFDALHDWMRSKGAIEAEGLVLGPAPAPPPQPEKELSQGEAAAVAFAEKRALVLDDLNVRYAHVGGWQGTEEELERRVKAEP